MRYVVVSGSETAHCCFEATVVDTARPRVIGGKPFAPNGAQRYENVCECLDVEDAEMIANALNAPQNETR